MAWFRTRQRLLPWLIGLFLVAQFSGVVPRVVYSQLSVIATATHAHGQHTHLHADSGKAHQHRGDENAPGLADQCCAQHLIIGVMPFGVAAVLIELPGEMLLKVSTPNATGVDPHLLDRPPRSLQSL